jgi:hypothetical protein
MFGIVRPCRHRLCAPLRQSWMSHLCGLCLTLRDEHGHAARLATNYDGLLVSVLAQAQAPEGSPLRQAGRCALRRLARADVLDAQGEGARLSAAVSLLLAAGKMRDHVVDGDGVFAGRVSAAAGRRLADRWAHAGVQTSGAIGFDSSVLTLALDRQNEIEHASTRQGRLGPSLLEITEPTESCVAAAFAHTAVLAGKPHNAAALAEAGRHFGRLAHLVDAVEDLEADRASGAYNPLIATGTSVAEARRHCEGSALGIELAARDLDLADDRLVQALLVREVHRAVERTFAGPSVGGAGGFGGSGQYGPGEEPEQPPPGRQRGTGGGDDCCTLCACDCCVDASCCECGDCCEAADCCDC